MDNLMLEVATWINSNGMWGKLLGLFYVMLHNMGWTIVVFTVCLKIVLIPLDIYQRHISAKTTEKQNEMKPELEKIQKIYGNNQEMINKKTMEIYRKHNFNLGSSCLGLLINIVITFVVFITLFNSLRAISSQMITTEFNELKATYIASYQAEYDNVYNEIYSTSEAEIHNGFTTKEEYTTSKAKEETTIIAQRAVYDKYQEIKESWLWIKNIYLTDTNVSPFPTFEKYLSNSGTKFSDGYIPLDNILSDDYTAETNEATAKALAESDYNKICGYIQNEVNGQWNGYYILIILAGLITWGSTQIGKIGQPKQTREVRLQSGEVVQKDVNPMGMMSWMLPLLMVFFTWNYTGLFAIYVVVNSTVSVIISSVILLVKVKIINPRKELRKEQERLNEKPHYGPHHKRSKELN